MNHRMVTHILGFILLVEAVLMFAPLLISVCMAETNSITGFAITIAILIIIGGASIIRKPKTKTIYAKEGFLIVALSWIAMALFGALPFTISGAIPSYVDAVFETVSGFTTTGATILAEVETLPKGILFWRSFTHWIGGMGVLVFIMAVLPLAESRSIHLMRAEMPGPTKGKLVPKMKYTALILYGIYVALTLIEISLLLLGGMPAFDSIVTAFSTAGTGGFAITNTSIMAYGSAYIDAVVTIFMILFGVNFNIYFFMLIGGVAKALKNEELWWYGGIIVISIATITANILPLYGTVSEALRYSSFQVASIITTTGFSTTDYNLWPELSKMILVILSFFGACASSTGGGIKIARLIILVKSALREMGRMIRPRSVRVLKLDQKPIDKEVINGANVYFTLYMCVMAVALLLLSFNGLDFETTFTSVVACINNVGPGLGLVGPMGNYAIFTDFSKIVLSFIMLVGRLEIFPILMLFSPSVWRKK